MDKKGAVELSMTTIIIIVIGITILSLGLVWIRSVFTDVGSLTEGAFERGEGEIADIFGGTDEIVALSPGEIGLEQGSTETASLMINNFGTGSVTVQASVEPIAASGVDTSKLVCAFSDTFDVESSSYTLNSGKGVNNLKLNVEDKGSALGNYGCKITVTGLEEGSQTLTLLVQIE